MRRRRRVRVGACGGGRGKGREEGKGEVGGRKREEGEGRDGWGKVVGWCGLAVSRDLKCAAAKELAAARFVVRRYC